MAELSVVMRRIKAWWKQPVPKSTFNEKVVMARDSAFMGFFLFGVIFFNEPYSGFCFIGLILSMIYVFAETIKERGNVKS